MVIDIGDLEADLGDGVVVDESTVGDGGVAGLVDVREDGVVDADEGVAHGGAGDQARDGRYDVGARAGGAPEVGACEADGDGGGGGGAGGECGGEGAGEEAAGGRD